MLKIFNTLTREKEEFKPLSPGTVTMYTCGPTVYNYAHIGNLRTYIFMDLVRRVFALNGYKLKGVMNITDVGHLVSDGDDGEDKMALSAKKQNKSPREIAEHYTSVFMKDLTALNIGMPEIVPKATEHIGEMIDYVVDLSKKGFAYETDDGIYFDISRFPDYGKLSGIDLEGQKAGARVEVNGEKRHHADFALWKKAPKEHIMQWPSPWGQGYPGWHIECSAMSKKYLGEVFDIHTGGVDHIPIHHENEIAQSEAREGKKTVNYWMHGEFMLCDGGKMSKSLGNIYTISDLSGKGYSPMDFRYFCLNAQYRKRLNFTFEGLDAAKTAMFRLRELLSKHKASGAKTEKETLERYKREFLDAVNDDLNVPLALGVLWTALKEPKSKGIFEFALYTDKVFGLGLADAEAVPTEPADTGATEVPGEITAMCEERAEAKRGKNFARADELRKTIAEKGYNIIDTPDGYRIERTK